MGLLQRAVETYDNHRRLVGQIRDGHAVLAPISHIVTAAGLEITLDPEGHFVNASNVSEPKIIIPATEGSAGRTSAPCAHPLCEQLGYLLPQNEVKYSLYVEQLTQWEQSAHTHPKLTAILRYIKGGTLQEDLISAGVLKLNRAGKPEDDKKLVRWRVLGEGTQECWQDRELFEAFAKFYATITKSPTQLCMITGEEMAVAEQHPKGIIPIKGNAKLISANDGTGPFTYRGRFTEEWQAATVGYETSQKAHNALRWLVQEQGVKFGNRTFVCWNPKGKTITPIAMPFMPAAEPIFEPSNYKLALKKTLERMKAEFSADDGVVLAAFDAATTGRLAVTYYNEWQCHDFLERLQEWDATCCWKDTHYGIKSPALWQILNCAFGTVHTEKGVSRLKADDGVMRQQMQRLICCRLERLPIGGDIVKALVSRASHPQAWEPQIWEHILSTACAVIRKYRYDRFKEEWKMALEPDKIDRSYQFGRLLAVMEKVERDAYDGSEGREPNAIRQQSVFCQRPMYTANNLEKQLTQSYFPRLNPEKRTFYRNLLCRIMDNISRFPQENWNQPLTDSYLMGYYLQRAALYAQKTDMNMEGSNDE